MSSIEWDKPVEDSLAHDRDDVPTHGQQKCTVREHHGRCSAASHGHAIPCDPTQSTVLTLNRIVCKTDRSEKQ